MVGNLELEALKLDPSRKPALLDRATERGGEVLAVDRLLDVVVRAAAQSLDCRAHVVHGRGEHDHDGRVVRFDPRQEVAAGAPRIDVVEDGGILMSVTIAS